MSSTRVYPQFKAKLPLNAIEPSTLTVAFDIYVPAGTTAQAEFSPDSGYLVPGILTLSTDPEVSGTVYAVVNNTQVELMTLGPNSEMDLDAVSTFGELLATKLILVGTAVSDTTDVRKITLNYTGGIYDYRVV
jgi:hypothetical protein